MFQDNLEALLQGQADPVNAGWQLRELSEKAQSHSVDLLDNLLDCRNLLANADPAIVGTILRILHASLLSEGWGRVEELDSQKFFDLEEAIPPLSSNRFLLQQFYAMIQDDESLELLVSSLSCKPPSKWVEAAQVLSPLMQKNDWNIAFFFSRSLVLLQQPSLASPLLDLANYVYREQRVPRHPMFDQVEMLRTLLGEVVGRLGMFEEDPRTFGNDIPVVQARLAEAVALAVSLCDAVALIGDLSSIG